MNRSAPIWLTLIILLVAGCSGSAEEDPRPNIIFLLSDDQRDDTFGAMGHPLIKTPNTDALINEGIRFTNTYIAEPVCSPSRVSFFTGMHERVHGVGFTSSYDLSDGQWQESYPALLRNSGYHTGFIGKFGLEYYSFKGRASEKFDYWRGHDGWAQFWPKGLEHCREYFDSEEDIITPIMGESIEEFLEQAPAEKPFCLSVSFSVPHGSQVKSMYPGSKEAEICLIPANEYEPLAGHPFYDTLYRGQNIIIPPETATDPYVHIPLRVLDQQKGRATGTYIYNYNTVSCREHHIRYYQMITGMDKVIGDMIVSLEEKGLSDNTIIIFASDHGLLMGEYGMGGKALLYDLVSKIPCFIYDPRLPDDKKGQSINELVSSLDITSTILEYAGIDIPEIMQGSSLVPLINGSAKNWREELFLESFFTGRDNPFCEGMRTADWKYIRMYRGGFWGYTEEDIDFRGREPDFEQLFNLEEDPGERNNLISKYEGSEILEELRQKTAAKADAMNDQRDRYKASHEIIIRNKN